MGAPHLREMSLKLGMYLLAYRPADGPPDFEAARVEDQRRFARRPPMDGIWATPFLNSPL